MVKKVEDLLNTKNLAQLGAIEYRKSEQMNYWHDVSKAKKLLNWSTVTSLEDGLIETIEWYRKVCK